MTIKVTVTGQDAQAAAQMQAVLNSILGSGQDDDQAEIAHDNQAGNAPDDDVHELTNAPVGYSLLGRHPNLDIALYEHASESSTLTLLGGVVTTLPGMTPEELFDFTLESDSLVELGDNLIAYTKSQLEEKDAENSKYMGIYHEFKESGFHLWAIYDLELCRHVFGDNYDYWLNGMTTNYQFIDYKDSREDFMDFIPDEDAD